MNSGTVAIQLLQSAYKIGFRFYIKKLDLL